MSNSLLGFADDVLLIADGIEKGAVELQKQLAKTVLREVAASTPVYTGRALSNWQVESGNPVSNVYAEAFNPGEEGATRSENLHTVVSIGDVIISEHKGGDLYISNPLDYVADLNDGTGWSKKPPHFVEAAVMFAVKSTVDANIKFVGLT
jgi:hypothetical protein